jgi:hypothetical protein
MKSPRTWFSVLAFLVLALFGAPVAHARPYCDMICTCDVPCSTLCQVYTNFQTTCGGLYGFQCAEKPACNIDLVASSSATTSNTSFGKADLLLESIFTPTTSMTR